MPQSLQVEAPSAALARSLVEHLDGFHAEVVPSGSERFQVCVDLDGGAGADRVLLDSLERVEHWLESSGLDLVEVRLNGRSYGFDRRDRTQIPPQR